MTCIRDETRGDRIIKNIPIQMEEAPVLLADRSQHQNPLKFFEVLLKGFCPTIILDRVDVHEDDLDDATPKVRSRKTPPIAASKANISSTPARSRQSISPSTPAKSIPTNAHQRNAKRARTNHKKKNEAVNHHEEPFEIGERPPSDVLGISKKMLQGFCYSPVHKKAHNGTTVSKHKLGFCSILTDHIGCFSIDDDLPDGEECSVDTCASSNVSVDLTPQSSPRDDLHNNLWMDEGYFDYGENLPIAEVRNPRAYRLTHVLLVTILALYTTLVLLQSTGPNKVLFAMERKHRRYPNNPKPITFAINIRPS